MSGPAIAASAAPLLVFGASGQVGRQVLARCEETGQPVLALSRQGGPSLVPSGVRWMGARLPDAVPLLPPVAAVLSLGPLDLFVEWFAQWQPSGSPPILALSSMSAVSKAESPLAAERELSARMCRAEDLLAKRCDRLGLPWTVLRPTMLWGAGMDRTLSPLARMAMRWHCLPMPRAAGQRQPVHVDDVAAAVLASVSSGRASGQRVECGGGERLTVAELFHRIRTSVPQRSVPVPVPTWLLRSVGSMARFNHVASAVARLDVDLLADNSQLESLLGIHPRGFAPEPSDWHARWPRA